LILELTLIWFSFWVFYNYILVPTNRSFHKAPLISGIVFVLFSFLSTYSAFGLEINKFLPFYILYIMSALIIYPYKQDLTGLLLNSLFQITWLYSFTIITGPNITLLGLIFFIYHIPILILDIVNIKVRVLMLTLSSVGGIVIALLLLIFPFPYSLLSGILLHFLTYYIFLLPIDRKYKFGIIN
jgi:hypothetical protein